MRKTLLIISFLFLTVGYSQPIAVSTTSYTVPELVTDVLINSPCVTATNITWRTGTNFGSTNGIGFFQNTNPNIPIQSGLILSTGNVLNAPGPNTTMLDDGNEAWTGDADLEATLAAAGIPIITANASVLEFDFTPTSSNFSFDFIFASEEYGNFQCQYSDAFAFLITNVTTGVTTNLAVVPGTNLPISIATIRDFAYNSSCPSANENLFGRFNGGSNAMSAAINFNGQTKLITASSVLTPNMPYHIKLVIADRLDYQSDSAIFISSNSLNIGQDVLGPDLTFANNTALCQGSMYVINTGLNPAEYSFIWKNGNTVIPGETGASLSITAAGTYSVTYENISGNCVPITNSIIIEFTSVITTPNPKNIYRCDSGAANYIFNLDSNTAVVKVGLDPATIVTYYDSQANANSGTNPLPLQYTSTNNTTIFVRIQVPSGCFVVKSFTLLISPPAIANQPANQVKCEGVSGTGKALFNLINLKNIILGGQSAAIYTVTFFTSQNDANNNTNPISQGAYYNNTTFYNSANTTIFVRVQNDSDASCFSITSFDLIVNPLPLVDVITQNLTTCTQYTLPPLTNGNYFTAPNGGGTPLFAGDIITETKTIYIYSEPLGTNPCAASSTLTVTVVDLALLTPANVSQCTSYTLPVLTSGKYYTQPGGNGTVIPSGTVITVTSTIYYYFVLPNLPSCVVDSSFQVTILPAIVLGERPDVFECTSYSLPALSVGKYYPAANGSGTQIPAGTVITSTQNIYVYATTAGANPCVTEDLFRVTIGITAPADIYQCNGYTLPSLPIGKYYTGPAGTGTMIPEGTVINSNMTLYIFQPTTSGQNSCINNLSFNLSFTQPIVDTLPDVSVCESYILPQLANGGYFTATDGGGNLLQVGDLITTSQTIYIFQRLNATCANESSFEVTILGYPVIDARPDIDICNQYVLTDLDFGDYYTGPNGTGTMLLGGTVITSTQLIYIYAVSSTAPFCSSQGSFQINIFGTTTDAPTDVTACDSYILPALNTPDSYYFTQPGGVDGTGVVIPVGSAITTTQTVYVYKETIIRDGFRCTAENSFDVTINLTPVIAPISNISACDSTELPALLVGNYFTGANGTGTLIPSGTFITAPQTIYVYANTNTTPDCASQTSFYVDVFNVDNLPDVTICGSYTLPSLTVGKYYTQSNGGGTQLFAGTVISTSQTVFIFLSSTFLPPCSDESFFSITIINPPVANPVPVATRTICDDDGTNDGTYNFDLTLLTPAVLGTQVASEYTLFYYETMANAIAQTNATLFSTSSTVFVRVNNTLAANCYDIKPINIIVNKLPFPTPLDGAVCIDYETGSLLNPYTIYSGLSASNHTFVWNDQTNATVGTNASYTATLPGIYSVVATNTATGCVSDAVSVNVTQSERAEVSYVVESDFSDNQRIIVTATGFGGDYEYQLDGGAFQDSNIFENVTSGIHNVNVRDKNGCGVTPIQVLVINYPRFFTPNGDGYNDTWNIKDLRTNSSARIIIYDRYGKIITSIQPSGAGWDGLYNGKMIMSDDYWFTVYYSNSNNIEAEFRAHFAMKR